MRESRLDRVVIDSNILLSHFINDTFDDLAVFLIENDITLYSCPEQLKELSRALNYTKVKKHLADTPAVYLKLFRKLCQNVTIDQRFDRVADIHDNYLFDLAYSVKSFFLVSGDGKVLGLKQVNQIRVISWKEYKKTVINAK